jgi:hypothetical protein
MFSSIICAFLGSGGKKNVCKKGGCANFVQIELAPESVQT